MRSGYDFSRRFQVTLDGIAENLTGATIVAVLKNQAKSAELIADTAQSSGSTGANWPTGQVVVAFPKTATTSLTPQIAWLEIGITVGGEKLPAEDVPIVIEKGWVA